MKIGNKHNRIEIWSGGYIIHKYKRGGDDMDLEVYQIEPIPNKPDYYMVEVGKPEDN